MFTRAQSVKERIEKLIRFTFRFIIYTVQGDTHSQCHGLREKRREREGCYCCEERRMSQMKGSENARDNAKSREKRREEEVTR